MKRDVLSLIEMAYQDAPDAESWLRAVAIEAAPWLDRGLGTYCCFYDVPSHGHPSILLPVLTSGNAAAGFGAEAFAAAGASPDGRSLLAKLFPRAPMAVSAVGLGGDASAIEMLTRIWGDASGRVADAFGVLAGDPSGHGIVLCGALGVEDHVHARDRRLWHRVAAHLASAYRLVRQARPDVDAVLRPDGRVEHVEPAAQSAASRTALRDETKSMDRARGRLRRADPEEAVAVWKGLVAGQWSLVDQVDSDGRRYVHARRNAPDVHAWEALSVRERQVLAYAAEGQSYKAIAYELGISTSTVATHLRGAARKAGVSSRLALVRAYQARTGGAA